MIRTTKEQRKALKRVWLRELHESDAYRQEMHRAYHSVLQPKPRMLMLYRQFRQKVQPGPGCIMVPFAGMWLGIEPDGYTHS